MVRLYLHSIVSAITNSSSELFTTVKDGAISKAREILARILPPDMIGRLDISAVVSAGYGDEFKTFTCSTDDELAEANKYMNSVDYPNTSKLRIIIKDNKGDIDLAGLFNDLYEQRSYMQ